MGDRAAQNEPARLDASDLVDLRSRPWLNQFVDRATKGPGVAEQRRDVAKQDALFRVVRDRADGVGKQHGKRSSSRRRIPPSISHSRSKAIGDGGPARAPGKRPPARARSLAPQSQVRANKRK